MIPIGQIGRTGSSVVQSFRRRGHINRFNFLDTLWHVRSINTIRDGHQIAGMSGTPLYRLHPVPPLWAIVHKARPLTKITPQPDGPESDGKNRLMVTPLLCYSDLRDRKHAEIESLPCARLRCITFCSSRASALISFERVHAALGNERTGVAQSIPQKDCCSRHCDQTGGSASPDQGLSAPTAM